MSAATATVPADTSALCEGCGYVLDGLPADHRCPECGKPIAESTVGSGRRLPAWERASLNPVTRASTFVATTGAIIFRPTRFYRALSTRAANPASRRFAHVHWVLASLLFARAAQLHANWFAGIGAVAVRITWVGYAALVGLTFVSLSLITRAATSLTAWEARYRGIRLPPAVIRRGMDYHAAHYLPVGLIALATVGAFVHLYRAQAKAALWAEGYLYVLCAEVVVSAGYLFKTYWIGMRNMMYANV